VREAPKASTSKLPGPAALALARAMQVIAGKDLMNDPDLMSHAVELERRARKPTEKDFDDATLAVRSARLQYKALDAIKVVLSDEA